MTLDLTTAENEIYQTYQWFAKEAPGVTAREEGRLAQLWAYVDRHLENV